MYDDCICGVLLFWGDVVAISYSGLWMLYSMAYAQALRASKTDGDPAG